MCVCVRAHTLYVLMLSTVSSSLDPVWAHAGCSRFRRVRSFCVYPSLASKLGMWTIEGLAKIAGDVRTVFSGCKAP